MSDTVQSLPSNFTSLVISDEDFYHDSTEFNDINPKENNQKLGPEDYSTGLMSINVIKNTTTHNIHPLNNKLKYKSMVTEECVKKSNNYSEILEIENEQMNNFPSMEDHHQKNFNFKKEDVTEYHSRTNENKQIKESDLFGIQVTDQQFSSYPNNQENTQQNILSSDPGKYSYIKQEYSSIASKDKKISPSNLRRINSKENNESNRIPRLGGR
ncbi:hypothetical protein NPIL_693361 [Nephila pilipes]|uniref:Uncharacterized protein n=1 Tax=Nephila pilipes TaxID=299642 RepID=A0A8X6R4S3_NEPPI|nr:hypothetical protein NPIL_693361 [Nephila pilipes]